MQSQKSLTLLWCSISEWSNNHVAFSFTNKHFHINHHVLSQPDCFSITWIKILKIVDTLLTLIFMMGQGRYNALFCSKRLQIHCIEILATIQHIDNPRCKAKNHAHWVDAHFQNGALTVLLAVLHLKVANTSLMLNSNQFTLQIPCLQDKI